jgi:hypothetical protein
LPAAAVDNTVALEAATAAAFQTRCKLLQVVKNSTHQLEVKLKQAGNAQAGIARESVYER